MKNIFRKELLLLLFLCFNNTIFSQNIDIKAEMGEAFFISKSGNGPFMKIGLSFTHNKNHKIGIFLSHIYMESSKYLPENLVENRFYMRDYTNVAPLGEENNALKWDENSFPKYRLKSKPNRFYKFNFGVSYEYKFPKYKNLTFGSEIIFSYCDNMEIQKVVNAKEMEFYIPPDLILYDYNFPVYSYSTYLDMGISTNMQYMLYSYRKINFGIKLNIYYYPFSSEIFSGIGMVIDYR